jgi:hypothetical protein
MFEEFHTDLETPDKKKKKKEKMSQGETGTYTPPEYLVQPAKGDKGFFMFKHAFDKMKKRFDTGFFSTTVNNMP